MKRLLARRTEWNGTSEKLAAVTDNIAKLHSRIEMAQSVEAANREIEDAIRTVAAELTARRSELERSQTECEELSSVPCQGRGEFAHCPKIQRAIRARQDLPH